MSFLSGASPGTLEQWELEEGQYIARSLSVLDMRARLAVLLSVGLVTAIEISNRMAINVLLPDMQGNVAANSDEISWAITLYNLGFLCSIAVASWMTRVIGLGELAHSIWASAKRRSWMRLLNPRMNSPTRMEIRWK